MSEGMSEQRTPYDLVLRNGTLIDGSGAPGRRGDLAVSGARIAALAFDGGQQGGAGVTEIDVAGRVVAPGFIDVHTHDDRAVLTSPEMTPKLSQGVTTVIVGNCGVSLSPLGLTGDPPPPLNLLGDREQFCFSRFSEYIAALNEARPSVNVAALIGHSSLRVGAMSDLSRKATASEIDVMRDRLAEALDSGAIGFSTGLWYRPNAAADMDEVVALAELLAPAGGVYATHMRDEHDGVLQSLEETFETGRRAGAPVVISHHKCAGPQNHGRSRETLPVIDAARRRQPVGLDAYPYAAGSTILDPDFVNEAIRILVTWSKPHPEMAGRDLSAIAADWGCDQRRAAERLFPAGAVYFQMAEEDVRRILAYPPTMIGSDGLPHDEHPHPRLWGTFPRVLGHYARDVGLFTLEQAVHKMTGLSAERFGLAGRGVLRAEAAADLVVFDPETIIDRASFEDPIRPAAGIELVVVNGQVAWRGGVGEARAGRFLHRTAGRQP